MVALAFVAVPKAMFCMRVAILLEWGLAENRLQVDSSVPTDNNFVVLGYCMCSVLLMIHNANFFFP